MKKKFYSILGLLAMSAIPALSQTSASFNFTGGMQTFTVPCGVDSITISCWGGQGGAGANGAPSSSQTGGAGAMGGYAQATFPVNTGDIFNIFVGGQGATPTGGFNGGGNGGSTNAGGGGGATDVRFGGTTENDRIIVAGGGGGGGRGGCESTLGAGGDGGAGGGGQGTNGQNSPTSGGDAGGGFGAIGTNGGGAGVGCSGFLGSAGSPAIGGIGGGGGNGQSCCCFSFGSIPGGGGGGGGFAGGGGGGGGSAGTTGCSGNDKGAGGGGAGGTSYTGSGANASTNNGIWLGNGMVTISWIEPIPAPANITGALSMCVDNQTGITLSTPSDPNATFYTWTVDAGLNFVSGQNTTSAVVAPMTAGTFTVAVFAVNGTCSFNGDPDTVIITVNPLPTVMFSVPSSTVCLDDAAVALTGTPAGGTFSGTAVTGNSFSPSTAGAGSFALTYSYTDSVTGCANSTMDTITVDLCLGVSALIPNGTIALAPNPTADFVVVSWNANTTVSSIIVTDVTGKVVMTENAINGTTKQLNVTALPAGTYTVSAVGDVTIVQSFVKK